MYLNIIWKFNCNTIFRFFAKYFIKLNNYLSIKINFIFKNHMKITLPMHTLLTQLASAFLYAAKHQNCKTSKRTCICFAKIKKHRNKFQKKTNLKKSKTRMLIMLNHSAWWLVSDWLIAWLQTFNSVCKLVCAEICF